LKQKNRFVVFHFLLAIDLIAYLKKRGKICIGVMFFILRFETAELPKTVKPKKKKKIKKRGNLEALDIECIINNMHYCVKFGRSYKYHDNDDITGK
jgi:hypothetical protein